MGEQALIDRLKWITEEHFKGTQRSLAKAMGCGSPYVSALFSGERDNPSSELLDNLLSSLKAARVNIRREWLLEGVGERYGPTINSGMMVAETGTRPDLTWLIKDYGEQTLIEKLSKVLLDAELPLAVRLDRASLFWDELHARVTQESSSAENASAADTAATFAVLAAADSKKPKPEVPH